MKMQNCPIIFFAWKKSIDVIMARFQKKPLVLMRLNLFLNGPQT